MSVRHLESQYTLSHLDTRDSLLDGEGNPLGKDLHSRNLSVAEVKDIVHLSFGNHECMPLLERVDVKKSEELVIFVYLIAGNLACDDT